MPNSAFNPGGGIFNPTAIAAVVRDALQADLSIPDGHRGAFVTVADATGVRAVLAHRVNDDPHGWIITAYVSHPWTGGLDEGVTIQKTW